MSLRLTMFAVTWLGSAACLARGSDVQLTSKDDTVQVAVGNQPFAVLHLNRLGKLPKPYLWPVRGPDGTILTRPIERKGDDHPHHKGVWVAVDEVNGIRFWAEKGKIITEKVSISETHNRGLGTGTAGRIRLTNSWRSPSRVTEVVEDTTITIYPNRLLDYDITFRPKGKPVVFGDTKEGLFGFRMVNSMRERNGGKVINSRGQAGTNNCWGKTAQWVDYYGMVNGKTYGVAIFDHPDNFRPSRYHVRNYGLFSISPFGERAYSKGKNAAKTVIIKPGGTLRLRYAMYIHAGDTHSARVADVYKQWVARTKGK